MFRRIFYLSIRAWILPLLLLLLLGDVFVAMKWQFFITVIGKLLEVIMEEMLVALIRDLENLFNIFR